MMENWKLFIIGSLFVLLKACGSSPSTEIASMALSNELNISLSELELVVESDQFEPVWEERIVSPGIKEFILKLKADKPVVPEKMNIRFSFPSNDVMQYWNPGNKMDKVNYYYNSIDTSHQYHQCQTRNQRGDQTFATPWEMWNRNLQLHG